MEYFTTDGVKIAYQISGIGTGPKVVLIHGLFVNSDCWREQLPDFEKEYQVLRMDLRGHGRSTKPKKRFTIADYASDLTKLLDSLGWTEDISFVGHSLGGMVALAYAVQQPFNLRKMVIASSYCFVSNEAVTDVLGRLNTAALPNFALGIGKRGLIPYNEETVQFIAKMVTEHMTKRDCMNATAASAGINICKNLRTLNIPILLLVGQNDVATPVWASEMLHEWLPQSELIVIPGAGHLIIFEPAEVFNKHVKEFLNEK
ncbi:MAG: alpha/beta fold hydrolase [Promethearchaeota archaeon]